MKEAAKFRVRDPFSRFYILYVIERRTPDPTALSICIVYASPGKNYLSKIAGLRYGSKFTFCNPDTFLELEKKQLVKS